MWSDQAQSLRNLTRSVHGTAAEHGIHAPESPGSLNPIPGIRPRLIAVTSGKGGVGKSNVTVNLGLCLAKMGYRTWLWDVDLGLGNADILLGLAPRYDLGHVVFGDRTLPEIVVEGPEGLRLIPGGSGWHQLAQLSQWRLNRLISELAFLEEDADFVLFDTGAGIGRGVIQFALAAQEVILVATPEPTALTDAYGLLKVIHEANGRAHVHLVVNQAQHEAEAKAARDRLNYAAERFLQRTVSLLGTVPKDPCVPAAVHRQEPFVLAFPRCPATKAVERIARRIIDPQAAPPTPPSGLEGLLRRMVGFLRR